MDEALLRDQVLRAEGYAQGFKDGFVSCATYFVNKKKEDDLKVKENESHT